MASRRRARSGTSLPHPSERPPGSPSRRPWPPRTGRCRRRSSGHRHGSPQDLRACGGTGAGLRESVPAGSAGTVSHSSSAAWRCGVRRPQPAQILGVHPGLFRRVRVLELGLWWSARGPLREEQGHVVRRRREDLRIVEVYPEAQPRRHLRIPADEHLSARCRPRRDAESSAG